MKKNVTLVILIIFLILLSLLISVTTILKELKEKNPIDQNNIVNNVEIGLSSQNYSNNIEGIIQKHDGIYINKSTQNDIYVTFPKDLYDEKGNSNKEYFEELIFDLYKLEELSEKSFDLIDEEKNIEINVIYDEETEEYKIVYNKIEDFYNTVDGEMYSQAEKSEIIKEGHLVILANEAVELINSNMFFKSIKNLVGEGIEINNTYTSFQNGGMLMRLLNGKVRNLVFTKKFDGEVLSEVTVGTDLETIKEKYPKISGEDLNDRYIYYRTDDVYVFCYDDEISLYGYSYFANTSFENFLEEYLNTNNLDVFIQKVSKNWTNHEKYEYNPETQTANITFPSRGVEINIQNNNPLGITLYNNYYLTEKTKKFVKDGKITLNANDDLLVISEKERRKNY